MTDPLAGRITITITELSAMGPSVYTIRRLIEDGTLDSRRAGRCRLITVASVRTWLEGEQQPVAKVVDLELRRQAQRDFRRLVG